MGWATGKNGVKVWKEPKTRILPKNKCAVTGKVKLKEFEAKQWAKNWVDTKGTVTAYKCKFGTKHWHVGHKLLP